VTAPAATMARPRRAVVAVIGEALDNDHAMALTESLAGLGIGANYLGRQDDAASIAQAVVHERADTVELCLGRGPGVLVLRELLRELIRVGRRDVSIVVHRIP
jgi:methylmalonyl-CoA mutase cobalamin-binding subunit